MKKLSILLLIVAATLLAACGAKRSQAYYDYRSKVIAVNYDGTYVIRVQVRSRNAATAWDDAKRKAVEEVIFNGVDAGTNGIQPLKPLVFSANARENHEAYFNAFFQDNGDWKKYASLHDKRTASTRFNRTHTQSVDFITVSVDRAALKARLINDQIIPQ